MTAQKLEGVTPGSKEQVSERIAEMKASLETVDAQMRQLSKYKAVVSKIKAQMFEMRIEQESLFWSVLISSAAQLKILVQKLIWQKDSNTEGQVSTSDLYKNYKRLSELITKLDSEISTFETESQRLEDKREALAKELNLFINSTGSESTTERKGDAKAISEMGLLASRKSEEPAKGCSDSLGAQL